MTILLYALSSNSLEAQATSSFHGLLFAPYSMPLVDGSLVLQAVSRPFAVATLKPPPIFESN